MSGRTRKTKTTKAKDAVDVPVVEAFVDMPAPSDAPLQSAVPLQSATTPLKKPSRKKQFPVVAVITPDGIEGTLMTPAAKRPLIVHFPIHSHEIAMNDMPVAYDPCPPTEAVPYDSVADNPFMDGVETVEEKTMEHTSSQASTASSAASHAASSSAAASSHASNASHGSHASQSEDSLESEKSAIETKMDFYKLKGTFLVQFKDASEVKALPERSSAACFWCCHPFPHRPVVLPVRDTGEHLIVTGNFCCPECAMSHLFDMHQDSHTRWEQMSLLYRVYGQSGTIRPAPPRASLAMFGGLLSIQEYRALIHSYTVRVDVHLPPMVSILATMDTKPIDFYDASLTKNVSDTVKERLQKAEEVLRLRRTKPLKAWESTLDACINLKIRHEPMPSLS